MPHSSVPDRVYCSQAVQCTNCKNGKRTCRYYDDNMEISKDTIKCNCGVQNET